jgi:Putative  PD-(D/E)XK family member, (DUF4420)
MTAGSTPSQLEQAFRATEAGGSAGRGAVRRRLLPDAALDVFTEVRFPTRDWALLVQSSERLEDRDLVLAAGLTCRTSNGCIEVIGGPQTERQLFCTLLADLLSQLPLSSNGPAAALSRRLTAWQRMLSRGLPAGLSPEKRVGLYGELLFLRDLMLQTIGSDAVRAWSGPSGAPQDFAYLSTAVEVKTVSRQTPGGCHISNEQQLDTTGLSALFLVYQVVVHATEGFTLVELIDELRGDPLVRADMASFENSLLEYGWLDTHRSQYAHDRYRLARRRCFTVRDDFPRLVPSKLPLGISAVSYLLDLSSCGSFQVDEEAVRQSLARAVAAAEG